MCNYTLMLATPATGILSLPVKNTIERKNNIMMDLKHAFIIIIMYVQSIVYTMANTLYNHVYSGTEQQ